MTYLVDISREKEPEWSSKVERWYQLDEVCYSFCEAIHQFKDIQKPDLIILALDGASNLSDFEFVNSGATSPSKFVYTLPNICISVLLQMLNHSAKVYCFHKGKKTLDFALQEGTEMLKIHQCVWVLSSSPVLEKDRRRVSLEVLV